MQVYHNILYQNKLVVIRRDNDERDKSRVDRVVDVDSGMLLLENDGWILPTDVLFVVHEDESDADLRDMGRAHRLSYDQARELPDMVRQFRAQEAGPVYKQFQDIVHQPLGDAKPIKITIKDVQKTDDGYLYSVSKGSRVLDGFFTDADIRMFIEQGYLPMPETTTADPNEAETRAPDPQTIDMKELNRLKKELKAKEKEISDVLTQNQHFVQQMAAQSKTYDDHLAARNATIDQQTDTIDKLTAKLESGLVDALERMSRIIQHQGRMLAESVTINQLPMETRTFQQVIPLEQRKEGYASDKDLNDVLDQGWKRVHTADVIEGNQIRRVHLLERVKPLAFPTGSTFHLNPASLSEDLIINGSKSVTERMDETIDTVVQMYKEKRQGTNHAKEE